jgi:hypothetical protein
MGQMMITPQRKREILQAKIDLYLYLTLLSEDDIDEHEATIMFEIACCRDFQDMLNRGPGSTLIPKPSGYTDKEVKPHPSSRFYYLRDIEQ